MAFFDGFGKHFEPIDKSAPPFEEASRTVRALARAGAIPTAVADAFERSGKLDRDYSRMVAKAIRRKRDEQEENLRKSREAVARRIALPGAAAAGGWSPAYLDYNPSYMKPPMLPGLKKSYVSTGKATNNPYVSPPVQAPPPEPAPEPVAKSVDQLPTVHRFANIEWEQE